MEKFARAYCKKQIEKKVRETIATQTSYTISAIG